MKWSNKDPRLTDVKYIIICKRIESETNDIHYFSIGAEIVRYRNYGEEIVDIYLDSEFNNFIHSKTDWPDIWYWIEAPDL
jgi:hypothetical protein